METIRPWLGLSLLQGIRGTSYNSIRETEALATSGQRQPAYDLAFHNIKRYPGPEARVHALTHWIDTVAVPRLWSLSHLGADKCQRVGHAGQRRTCRIRPATTTPKNRHFKRNCPRLRNNDRGNQAGNDRAPVKVYVVGNAGANPDNIVAVLLPVSEDEFGTLVPYSLEHMHRHVIHHLEGYNLKVLTWKLPYSFLKILLFAVANPRSRMFVNLNLDCYTLELMELIRPQN
ncbi:hypothetical protein Tco_0435663 [Tanacetum coccineum]